jgi:hypothetical protein
VTLRDDDGDDSYSVEMFGQGAGYFLGIGILVDRAGGDRYDGVRYVQGAGVHGGVGLLADGAGADSYAAAHGVGQGMGLDMALGALDDRGGDDSYHAGTLAQGAGTANGIGVLLEGGGADRFILAAGGWGQDHVARNLPGPSFLLGADSADRFVRGTEPATVDIDRPGGPDGGPPYRRDPPGDYACPPPSSSAMPLIADADLTALIRRSAPMHGSGPDALSALAALAALAVRLPAGISDLLKAVPPRDFATGFALLQAVRCVLASTDPAARPAAEAALRDGVLDDAAARRPVGQPWLHARLLALTRLPDARPAVELLSAHPACSARAAALDLAGSTLVPGAPLPDWLDPILRAALKDRCLRLPAEALRLLDRFADPALTARRLSDAPPMPAFLADPTIRATLWPP